MSPLAMKRPCALVVILAVGFSGARLPAAEGWSPHMIAEVSSEEAIIKAFAVGDFNADRQMDLAVLLHRTDGTSLLRAFIHPGPADVATRWPSVDVATFEETPSTTPGDLVAASLDGGPVSQIVTSHASVEAPLVVHRPPTDPATVLQAEAWSTAPIPLNTASFTASSAKRPPAPFRLAAAQLDDRPGHELIVATAPRPDGSDPGRVGWFEPPGPPPGTAIPNGAAWKFHRLASVGTRRPMVVADLTRDGADDLVLIHPGPRNPGIHWLTNPGPGSAPNQIRRAEAWLHTQIGPGRSNFTHLAAGDLGQDGYLDVVATADIDRAAVERITVESDAVENAATIASTADRTDSADSQGAGEANSATATSPTGAPPAASLRLFIQHAPGPPGWKPYPIPLPPPATHGTALALADLNGDGHLDIVHAANQPPTNSASAARVVGYHQILIGPQPAWILHPITQTPSGRYRQLHAADLNQDTAPDLITLLQTGTTSQLLWLENP